MTTAEALAKAKAWQERLFPRVKYTADGGDGSLNNPIRHYTHVPTLPEICLDLRASISGASDPWDTPRLTEVRDMLRARMETWGLNHDPIDYAVLSMVREVVRMASEELARRPEGSYPALV